MFKCLKRIFSSKNRRSAPGAPASQPIQFQMNSGLPAEALFVAEGSAGDNGAPQTPLPSQAAVSSRSRVRIHIELEQEDFMSHVEEPVKLHIDVHRIQASLQRRASQIFSPLSIEPTADEIAATFVSMPGAIPESISDLPKDRNHQHPIEQHAVLLPSGHYREKSGDSCAAARQEVVNQAPRILYRRLAQSVVLERHHERRPTLAPSAAVPTIARIVQEENTSLLEMTSEQVKAKRPKQLRGRTISVVAKESHTRKQQTCPSRAGRKPSTPREYTQRISSCDEPATKPQLERRRVYQDENAARLVNRPGCQEIYHEDSHGGYSSRSHTPPGVARYLSDRLSVASTEAPSAESASPATPLSSFMLEEPQENSATLLFMMKAASRESSKTVSLGRSRVSNSNVRV